MKVRFSLLALAAVVFGGTALAQSVPFRLVQAGDGSLWVIADRTKHRITPDPIGDRELAALPDGEPWSGTIGESVAPAAATAPAPDGVLVRSVASTVFRQPSGGLRAVGVIENAGQFPAASIRVTVSLLDRGGAAVGAAEAVYAPYVLRPGARAGWVATLEGEPSFAEVRVQVSTQPSSPNLISSVVHDFRLEDLGTSRAVGELESPKIRGRAVNTGSVAVTGVRVLASVYDQDGSLLDVYQGRAALPEIGPGQSATFEVDTNRGRVGPEIVRYDLFVEGFAKN